MNETDGEQKNGPEFVELRMNIPKAYMERIKALYELSGKDPDYEPRLFITEAIRSSLEMYVSQLGIMDDPELKSMIGTSEE